MKVIPGLNDRMGLYQFSQCSSAILKRYEVVSLTEVSTRDRPCLHQTKKMYGGLLHETFKHLCFRKKRYTVVGLDLLAISLIHRSNGLDVQLDV